MEQKQETNEIKRKKKGIVERETNETKQMHITKQNELSKENKRKKKETKEN